MSETTVAARDIIAGKNAAIAALQDKMGTCPYYGTIEILDDVLIQKPSWGGKDVPENKTKLSAAGNVAYMQFARLQEVLPDQSPSYYQELYEAFLKSEKPVLTEANLFIQILKNLLTLRGAFMEQKNATTARIRNRGKELDMQYPIPQANRVKQLEKIRKDNEPLLKELKVDTDFSWQNLLGFSMAQMGYVQKTIIEKEIESLIANHPMWKYFGAHIPGFGPVTCAMFIAKLQDPLRFPDSGKVRGFSGIACPNGKTQKMKRGEKLNYDPDMKAMLCEILPDSYMKTSARNPNEPYAQLFQACRAKQRGKAISTTPAQLAAKYNVPVENITSLGFGTGEEKDVFKGFKVQKVKTVTDKGRTLDIAESPLSDKKVHLYAEKEVEANEITTLNPGHVLQRAKREWGSIFISDFYHAWVFFAGANVRIAGNPRIMAVFEKANVH